MTYCFKYLFFQHTTPQTLQESLRTVFISQIATKQLTQPESKQFTHTCGIKIKQCIYTLEILSRGQSETASSNLMFLLPMSLKCQMKVTKREKNKTPAYWTLFPMKNYLFKLAVKMPLLPTVSLLSSSLRKTFLKHSATLLPAVSFERCSAPHTITNHHARLQRFCK